MGVKGLFPFLKSHAPKCISVIEIEALRGKRIAIDGNLLLFREYASPWLSVTHPKKNILWAIRLTRLCRQYDITPIVVFDSTETTPAKAQERAKRFLKRERSQSVLRTERARSNRLEALSKTITELDGLSNDARASVWSRYQIVQETVKSRDTDQRAILPFPKLSRDKNAPVETFALAKRLVKHLENVLLSDSGTSSGASELNLLMEISDPSNNKLPLTQLEELQATTASLVDRMSRRVTFPTYRDISRAYLALRRLKIPTTMSPDFFEGECTASDLVHRGLADYVATQDSDVLVYGVPQLRGFMGLQQTKSFSSQEVTLGEMIMVDPVIMRQELSTSTPWSVNTFIDFAIMCGTDFSSSIARLGIKGVHELFLKYATIEDAIAHVRSVTLKTGERQGLAKYTIHESFAADVEITRNIFTTYPSTNLLVDKLEKTSRGRVQGLAELQYSMDKLKKLNAKTDLWTDFEKVVLEREGMQPQDLELLDSPNLYRHRGRRSTISLRDSPHSDSQNSRHHDSIDS